MKSLLGAIGLIALGGCASALPSGPEAIEASRLPVTLTMPAEDISMADQQVLFWNSAQRLDRFARMEDFFVGLEIAPASEPRAIGAGEPLPETLQTIVSAYMANSGTVGVMVLEDGKVRHATYADGFSEDERWTSFSVAKSFTSTLMGAAIRDGEIASLDDPVTKYIPELTGSVYDPVTVRQIATMTSGVKWNEDYSDPNSDVARMLATPPQPGEDQSVVYMRTLEREARPGEKFVYKTGETNLLGIIVENATGKKLGAYAHEKLVVPAGFAAPMFWMLDLSQRNIGGCCLSLTLADYARFGQFVLDGGQGVVPDGWFEEAGSPAVKINSDTLGYGYQWWTSEGGNFGAQGIFGQSVTILPQQKMVVAMVGNWPSATSNDIGVARRNLIDLIAQQAD